MYRLLTVENNGDLIINPTHNQNTQNVYRDVGSGLDHTDILHYTFLQGMWVPKRTKYTISFSSTLTITISVQQR